MATKIMTPPFVASYCFVLEAKENLSGAMKYSISMIFDKDKTDMSKIEAAVKAAAAEKFGKKIPKNFKLPIRDGDEDRDDREEYKNAWFINASSDRKPGVVDYKTGDIIDTDDDDLGIYSGCVCRATIAFFGFDNSGSKGVGAGLNNIQVLKRGDRLDGSVSADTDFGEADEVDLDAL